MSPIFGGRKKPSGHDIPYMETKPAPIVWHPVAKAELCGSTFDYDGSRTAPKIYVSNYPFGSTSFVDADHLRRFAEACIQFADHIDGLRSFTETEPKT